MLAAHFAIFGPFNRAGCVAPKDSRACRQASSFSLGGGERQEPAPPVVGCHKNLLSFSFYWVRA